MKSTSQKDVLLFTKLMNDRWCSLCGADLWSCSPVSEVSREVFGRDLSPQRSRFSALAPESDLLVTEEQPSVHQKEPEGLWLVVGGSCRSYHQTEDRNKSRCPASSPPVAQAGVCGPAGRPCSCSSCSQTAAAAAAGCLFPCLLC